MLAGNFFISLAGSEEQIIFFQQSPKMLKIVSENFIHALLLFLGLFLKISRWVPLHLVMKHCVSCLIYYFNNKSPCLICFQVYRILYLVYSIQLRDLVDWHAHDIAEVLSIIAESSATVTILKATTSSSVRTASVKNAVAAEVTIMTGLIGSRQFGVCKKI